MAFHLWHLPRRPLVNLTHLFNHCLQLSHFPKPWKEAKFIILPKPELCSINLLSTINKPPEEVILKIVQMHTEERGLLNARQFIFHACHSMPFHCMRLTDDVTLNLNNNMSMAVAFLDIEKAFDTTWYIGLLHKLS
jgi:hypothetical protein